MKINYSFLFILLFALFLSNTIDAKARICSKKDAFSSSTKEEAVPKSLKKYYMIQMPLKDYKPDIAKLIDINSLDVLFVISFENEHILKTAALISINMDRLSSFNQGYVIQQAVYAGPFLSCKSYKYEFKNGYLFFNDEKFKFDSNNQLLYNESSKQKLDAYTETKGKEYISIYSKIAIYIFERIGQNSCPDKFKKVLEEFTNEPLSDFLAISDNKKQIVKNESDNKEQIVRNESNNKKQDEIEQEPIYEEVDKLPEFPGGGEGLLKFLSENTKYPTICQENGIQDKVLVSFVIDKDGTITNVKVEKRGDPYLDKEAIRVVSNMPKWKPGIKDGKTVRVRYSIPIVFGLN